jgi:hypothetical protein
MNNRKEKYLHRLPLSPAAFRTRFVFDGMANGREPRTVICIISRQVNFGLNGDEILFEEKRNPQNLNNYLASRTRA